MYQLPGYLLQGIVTRVLAGSLSRKEGGGEEKKTDKETYILEYNTNTFLTIFHDFSRFYNQLSIDKACYARWLRRCHLLTCPHPLPLVDQPAQCAESRDGNKLRLRHATCLLCTGRTLCSNLNLRRKRGKAVLWNKSLKQPTLKLIFFMLRSSFSRKSLIPASSNKPMLP